MSGDLFVLDPSSGETTRRIPVQGTPELVSFDPSDSHAYVETDARAGQDGHLLVELDSGRAADRFAHLACC